MESLVENFQQPDESRPAKRARLDAPLHVTEDVQEEIIDDGDDWNDIYGDADDPAKPQNQGTIVDSRDIDVLRSGAKLSPKLDDNAAMDAIPAPTTHKPVSNGTLDLAPVGERATNPDDSAGKEETQLNEDGVPMEALDDGNDFIDEQHHVSAAEEPAVRMVEEISAVNENENPVLDGLESAIKEDKISTESRLQPQDVKTESQDVEMANVDSKTPIKATEDAEFMAAAAAQKESKTAEWQFDSSDAESSSESDSDSESDSEDSDDDSEGGYEMLDPATAAKMLMQGDGEDDDGDKGKKSNGDRQPRTANEIKETFIPKPDVKVTEDMKITELGTVERAVENMVLIKGSTPGEYQVLESGSVLCNERREVIGAVLETLGRVQAPMYSMQFTNAQEIEDVGLGHGVKVYYVDNHSTFVFTQPLKSLKGTDASNIHDEEVGEEEMEFSDDEAEAEYKRQKKQAKKAGRGGMNGQATRGGFRGYETSGHEVGMSYANGSDAPRQNYGGGMSYDDEPGEDFYSPLKRPDNLGEMMSGNGAQTHRPQTGTLDRGRGRGRGDRARGRGDRGRGRGDRGRGRGGFDNVRGADRGRGHGAPDHQHVSDRGRGNGNLGHQNSHKGNAQSFPDRHNNEPKPTTTVQHALPPKPDPPQYSPAPVQQYTPPNHFQQPTASTYQFNGYTFQHGVQAQQPQPPGYYNQQLPPAAANAFIPGAYVNPAYYPAQQVSQQQQWGVQHGPHSNHQMQPQIPATHPALNGQQGYAQAGSAGYGNSDPPQQQHQHQQQQNLADVLRRLGGQS